jgi:predicted RNase H-like HicB family nuclease
MKLRVLIEQDETGYFTAEVPALTGCISQGKTKEEALANISEAIEGWLDVMEQKQIGVKIDPLRLIEVRV